MATTSNAAPKSTHPLPLSSTLHDLALLRASDLDFVALLTSTAPSDHSAPANTALAAPEVEDSVTRSVEFSKEARAALRLAHSDTVDREGARVEAAREKLEDVVSGLETGSTAGPSL